MTAWLSLKTQSVVCPNTVNSFVSWVFVCLFIPDAEGWVTKPTYDCYPLLSLQNDKL